MQTIAPEQAVEKPLRAKSKSKGMRLPDEIDLERLCDAIMRDYRDLEPFRSNRMEAVRQMGGARYGDDCAPKDVPVNLIGTYVRTVKPMLIDNNPRVMYRTFEKGQQQAVDAMQQWANDEIERTGFVETYGRVVTDALIWKGIVKIALATPSDAAVSGWDLQAGQPFMELVDPEDYVCDQSARMKPNCEYEACRYRIPVAVFNELYAKGRVEEAEEGEDPDDVNFGGDEKIQTLSRRTGRREEVEPHMDLWEVYLPRHKLVVILRDASGIPDSSKEPVLVQKWIGPPCGPYHWLGFEVMPGQLEPKGPAMDLLPLHLAFNASWRKLIDETLRYKKNQGYRGGGTDSAKRLRDAVDGEMIEFDDPQSIVPIESGGASNAVHIMAQSMQAAFEFVAGNPSTLAGDDNSGTATQAKINNQNASAGVGNLRKQFVSFMQGTMESMNWYWWNHPTKVMTSQWTSPALPDMKFNRTVTPQERRGPMPDIRVDPYSLPRQTPQGRLAFINTVIQTVGPMMGLMQQQGVSLDMNALLDIFARYGDEPDLARIFRYTEPPADGGGQPAGGGGMPANTTRTYERYGAGGDGSPEPQLDLADPGSKMTGTVNPNQ